MEAKAVTAGFPAVPAMAAAEGGMVGGGGGGGVRWLGLGVCRGGGGSVKSTLA